MGYRREERLRVGPGSDPLEELEAELRAHLDMRVQDLIARGWAPEEAREEALRRFGDLEGARRSLARAVRRREHRLRWSARAEGILRDVAWSFRTFRRAPGATALFLLILGTAIGLACATFSVTDHVLLRPLPYPEPSELVALQSVGESGSPFYRVSEPNWVDWKERGTTLEATALWSLRSMTIGGSGTEPFRVEGAFARGDLWGTLGAAFVAGRPFTEAEAQAGERLAVLSEELWTGAFGRAPLDALRLVVDGTRYPVVGVVAAGRGFPEGARLWLPERYAAGGGAMRNNLNFEAVARLAEGATLERAREELSRVARGIRETDPEALYSYGVGVTPLRERIAGDARGSIVLLMSAVLLVLAVACANLAGLGLARARRREGEHAVRLALGAGRGRIARQVLVEHAVLAALGGALGVALARAGTGRLLATVPERLPRAGTVSVDGRVLAFAAGIAALAALVTAAGPVAAVLRGRIAPGIRKARGRIGGGRGLPGAAMVAAELALATALLTGGGLLVRSFLAAASRPLGFDPEGVVTLEVILSGDAYDDTRASVAYWKDLLERLRADPSVAVAAVGNWIPTGGSGTGFIDLEGGADADLGAGYRVVSDRYFEAMGTPVLAGRTFERTDDLGTERVGLVNANFAERYWPGGSPLGMRVRATSMEAYYHGGEAPWITIVGVVGDVRHHGFESDPRPEMFVLYRQVPDWTRAMTAVVRTRPGVSADGAVQGLRERTRAVDPSLAVEATTLASRVRALLAERRLVLAALWTFAGLAALLACLGVYALISFAAQERAPELAVRAALGADRRGLLALMLKEAGRVVLCGLTAGLLAGYALTRVLRSLLLDVSPTDPVTYAAAALLLGAVGVAAALVPSWRAARADPLEALAA